MAPLPLWIAPTPPEGLMILRRVGAQDFTGPGGRLLDVPAGWAAVSAARVWPAGRQAVPRRWLGRAPVLTLVALGPWTLSVAATGLLAGDPDGELVDADVGLCVAVSEPRRLCEQIGRLPNEWRLPDLVNWLEPRVRRALAPCVRRYLAADLIGGGPAAERARAVLRPRLAVLLAEVGLDLEWAQPPVITRAADVVLLAHRLSELKQGLQGFENRDTMRLPGNRVGNGEAGGQPPARIRGSAAHVSQLAATSSETQTPAAPQGFFARLWAANPRPSLVERGRIARLFQRQLSVELNALAARVRPARLAAFRAGQIAEALALRELERRIADLGDETTWAQPAYVDSSDGMDLRDAFLLEDQVLMAARELVGQADALDQAGVSDSGWPIVAEGVAGLRRGLQARLRRA